MPPKNNKKRQAPSQKAPGTAKKPKESSTTGGLDNGDDLLLSENAPPVQERMFVAIPRRPSARREDTPPTDDSEDFRPEPILVETSRNPKVKMKSEASEKKVPLMIEKEESGPILKGISGLSLTKGLPVENFLPQTRTQIKKDEHYVAMDLEDRRTTFAIVHPFPKMVEPEDLQTEVDKPVRKYISPKEQARQALFFLNTMHPRALNHLFTFLDPVSSVCLGMASKRFLPVHKVAYPGKRSLFSFALPYKSSYAGESLMLQLPENVLARIQEYLSPASSTAQAGASKQLNALHCRTYAHQVAVNKVYLHIDAGKNAHASLLNLPTSVMKKIMKLMDPASSAILGVTCKQFYQVHAPIHGKVSLTMTSPGLPPLWSMLGDWGSKGYVFVKVLHDPGYWTNRFHSITSLAQLRNGNPNTTSYQKVVARRPILKAKGKMPATRGSAANSANSAGPPSPFYEVGLQGRDTWKVVMSMRGNWATAKWGVVGGVCDVEWDDSNNQWLDGKGVPMKWGTPELSVRAKAKLLAKEKAEAALKAAKSKKKRQTEEGDDESSSEEDYNEDGMDGFNG